MPAADKIRRRLARRIGSKRSVHVRCGDAAYTTDGFVLAIGRKWVLLAKTTEGGFFDGHVAIRLSAISEVRVDTGFQPRFARTQVEWPPGLPPGVVDPDLDTTEAMLSTLLVANRLVGLEPDGTVIWIGIPYRLRGRSIALWEVDPKARWADKPRRHPLRQLVTVQLGTQYLRGLAAMTGPPPGKAQDSPWARQGGGSASPTARPGAQNHGFCCNLMADQMQWRCERHPSPWDCADVVVVRQGNGDYGLPIRDGEDASAGSSITIAFCPWCGARLSHPRRPGARLLDLGKR